MFGGFWSRSTHTHARYAVHVLLHLTLHLAFPSYPVSYLALVCLLRGSSFDKQGKHGAPDPGVAPRLLPPPPPNACVNTYCKTTGLIDYNINAFKTALGDVFSITNSKSRGKHTNGTAAATTGAGGGGGAMAGGAGAGAGAGAGGAGGGAGAVGTS